MGTFGDYRVGLGEPVAGSIVRAATPDFLPRTPRMPQPREAYPRVFLSYRRDDSEAYAGRLHQAFVQSFGANDVFMDIFSIEPGEPFAWAIQQAATRAVVMVALIGPQWLTIENSPGGGRRLNSSSDFVRRELVAALDRGTIVIPLLVRGADFLDAAALPEELRMLAQFQALDLTARHWSDDVRLLVDRIAAVLGR